MSTPSPSAPGATNWILLNILGVVWGTSFLSISISLETMPPLTLAATRVTIAAIALTQANEQQNKTLNSFRAGKFI